MLLKGINDNPLSARWKKRFSEQPIETQKKLEALNSMNSKDYQFKVIKKTKNPPNEGDIFLVSPREGVYFYGRVLKSDINHITKDTFIHGKSVVVIFKSKTNSIDMANYFPNYDDLLIGPEIVDSTYWSKGFFFTIANLPIDQKEKQLDYGFYSIGKGKYFKENGIEIDHKPIILGTYGIATITGIARNVEKELIIDPALLDF
ncbi:Imm26 family immunity protein [Oceanirhabdus sp. W0125-5]|uniref:Imm26 family immunity protein n=1 Tax=Oceanirhabdus sp. W0125-5 TaxID=2999116 RepID=UPI0022F30906|nr:Imm26 family immunity protein [Oceanirhabdus sp. W0125-5]WBW98143.1 Imm26 family immunity protein [Oceanirhabdus sp. W0125-5]